MFSETAYSSQTKLIGQNLHVSELGIGYSNLTLDPQGARGTVVGFKLSGPFKFFFNKINVRVTVLDVMGPIK